jgi:hypothetical protein
VAVTNLTPGRATRQVGAVGCEKGCRLTGFSVPMIRLDQVRIAVHGVRQADPAGDVIPPAELVRRERWRPSENAQVAPVGPALVITSVADPFSRDPVMVSAVDAALPVPVGGGRRR